MSTMNAINYITTSTQGYALEVTCHLLNYANKFYKHDTKLTFRYLSLIRTCIM